MELFCLVAEHGGFSAAAQAAGLTPAAVSRSVARLEARLGVRLFTRTTRRVSLTEAGRRYFEQCSQALAQLIEAERALSGEQSVPAGVLRISLPTTYGHYRVLPLLPEFRARYPQIRLDVEVSNRNVDFASDGFDLAIRARPPSDSSLIARPLEATPLRVVASPAYLRQAGTPMTLADLAGHQCIQFLLPRNGRPVPWLFRDQGRDLQLATTGDYCCAQDVLAGTTLARSGAGLFQALGFIVEDDLRQGRLVEVLQAYGGRSRPFTLLYPSGRHVPQRVRVFVDFLLQAVGR